ncbi:hypothetical protein [Roseibium aggregatum]|uniref:hypothetical protein n=1 Tax=Roseibium aggregatum TaxID=187304 RepID=UPI001E519886|nr:hypothetical protein [Roseibium aggregatum]MCR9284823.1 hypothetical protein [Paracoccaceae bacterium]UES42250.1 hypothetical protein GFC08_30075 [Roseibium aggregatum]
MSENKPGSASTEDLQLHNHAAVDTVAFYVKDGTTLRDFFRHKPRNSRRETFAIQAAENEGMQIILDEPE